MSLIKVDNKVLAVFLNGTLGGLYYLSGFAVFVVIYVCVSILLVQNIVIYPHRFVKISDEFLFESLKIGMIETADGVSLKTYYTELYMDSVLLYFHGNGGLGAERLVLTRMLNALGYDVVFFSYRGYGGSTGTPDEVGIMIDAYTAMSYVLEKYKNKKIHLYGVSLGAAVAIYALSAFPAHVQSLTLQSPFLRLESSVYHVAPWLRFFWFVLTEKWYSDERIAACIRNNEELKNNLQVNIIYGGADNLTPPWNAEELLRVMQKEGVKNIRTRLIKGADHNEIFDYSEYEDEMLKIYNKKNDAEL